MKINAGLLVSGGIWQVAGGLLTSPGQIWTEPLAVRGDVQRRRRGMDYTHVLIKHKYYLSKLPAFIPKAITFLQWKLCHISQSQVVFWIVGGEQSSISQTFWGNWIKWEAINYVKIQHYPKFMIYANGNLDILTFVKDNYYNANITYAKILIW